MRLKHSGPKNRVSALVPLFILTLPNTSSVLTHYMYELMPS